MFCVKCCFQVWLCFERRISFALKSPFVLGRHVNAVWLRWSSIVAFSQSFHARKVLKQHCLLARSPLSALEIYDQHQPVPQMTRHVTPKHLFNDCPRQHPLYLHLHRDEVWHQSVRKNSILHKYQRTSGLDISLSRTGLLETTSYIEPLRYVMCIV